MGVEDNNGSRTDASGASGEKEQRQSAGLEASSSKRAGLNELGHTDFQDTQDFDLKDALKATVLPGMTWPESVAEGPSPASASATPNAQVPPQSPSGVYDVAREPARAETVAPKDALNRTRLAEVLAALLAERDDRSPLAVVIWGPWGSGKSSLVEFLKVALQASQKARFQFAEFNAWRNERVENVGAALAQGVVEALGMV